MKKCLSMLILLISLCANAQELKNYIVTKEGEKVSLPDQVTLGRDYISFDGGPKIKNVSYMHKDLKMMVFSGRVWLLLPLVKKRELRLQEVICYNDSAILVKYWHDTAFHILIFDWNQNIIQPHQVMPAKFRQAKYIRDYIEPYFRDSHTLLDKMYKNVDDRDAENCLANIAAYKCGKRDITELMK
ncbi:MAG TPA: hypothetical protein VGO45_10765 [Bacteroidia bacterium]|jgi:hypothetical protein|nr:hypothetical protein [Bacteroidia bacterium]